ncbi:aquaporin [Paraburkholderia adhaesiva]|uniref:aquaporin n=1 Tax=Paraburkholderia adhaesiva TaxID=2883244 RepID=UPI001F28EE2A|nr:aquaporin [Paraburkholderia adhaesiva]
MKLGIRLGIEAAGSAWLVFAGCASAAINVSVPMQGRSVFDMAMAFGLALCVATFAAGRVASAHFNPAVTIGYTVAGRFPVRDVAPYIATQTIGAIAGAALLAFVAGGRPGFAITVSELGANGYGEHSPGDYALHAVFAVEFALSFAFVAMHLIMSISPRRRASAPVALGACLTVICLIAIPVSNGGINPSRSTGPALFVGDWALDQLWLFWAAPMVGGISAGLCHRFVCQRRANARHSARSYGNA